MSIPSEEFWFGPAGNIRKLSVPKGQVTATRPIETTVFQTGSGGARVNKAMNGLRTYALPYSALGRQSWEYLNKFHQGLMGPGPFVFVDPGRRNLLTANQSSGCSLRNDTTGFTVTGAGGSGAVDSTLTTDFPRTFKWAFATSSPASAALSLDKPHDYWPGTPIVPTCFYTFWSLVLGVVGTTSYALQLQWLDINGAVLSTVNGTALASSVTTWQEAYVSAMAPINAVYVRCGVAVTLGSIVAGRSLNFSALQLQEGDVPDPYFSVGTGINPVAVTSLSEVYGFHEPGMMVSPTLTLQEVR